MSKKKEVTPVLTYRIEEAARMLGICKAHAYATVRDTGELVGVKVFKFGRSVRIPKIAFDKATGKEAQS